MKPRRKTRVMLIDHMPLARKAVVDGLRGSRLVEIADVALSPGTSLRKLSASQPDVILLDLEDPASEETRTLAQVVREVQLPVVLLTSMDERARGALVDLMAIEPDMVIEKPASNLVSGIFDLVPVLETKLKSAHNSDLLRWRARFKPQPVTPTPPVTPDPPVQSLKPIKPLKPVTPIKPVMPVAPITFRATGQRIIAIGASTGGTEVIAQLLASLPRETPGIVIVQHMPSGFTRKFAERLDQLSAMDVNEAEDRDPVRPGCVLIAPGGRQLRVVHQSEGFVVRVQEADKFNGHCPSVDVLLSSVAQAAGSRGIGVVLTGMGKDGAAGLLEMRRAGARTLAQDQESSVVFGMPAEAERLGAAEKMVSAHDLAKQLAMAATL